MSLRNLPEPPALLKPQNYRWEVPGDIQARWASTPRAESSSDNVISILDFIGEDPWTGGGVTAKRVAAALRSIGEKPVRVEINSPGGDLFEGLAIYNLLRKHKSAVTVEVLGWAASAASIIAMAGDEIRVGLGSFVMVHNAWGICIGNRHDMAEASELFASFDRGIADVYVARTGRKLEDVQELMDKETFMGAQRAVDEGFADVIDEGISADDEEAKASMDDEGRRIYARRQAEGALAARGFSRKERAEMLNEISAGARDAARNNGVRDAADQTAARDAGIRAGLDELRQALAL